jgi:hypothetical protein
VSARTYKADEVTFTVDGERIDLGMGKVEIEGAEYPYANGIIYAPPGEYLLSEGLTIEARFEPPRSRRERRSAAALARHERKRAAGLLGGGR